MAPFSSARFILDNSAGPLLVEDAVAALAALDHITRLQRVLGSTISAEVADRFRLLRIHPASRELGFLSLSLGREHGAAACGERDFFLRGTRSLLQAKQPRRSVKNESC